MRATILTVLLLSATASADGPFPPHRIIDDVYYVGSQNIACYLVTSNNGHILINSGFEDTVPLIKASVESLGFKMKDVRFILASHAHADHVAGHALLKEVTGADVCVMQGDADVVRTGGDGQYLYTTSRWAPCQVDRILYDSETVKVGDKELTARLTAGHTPGCTTWTWKGNEGDSKRRVVVVGSPNVNPGYQLVNNSTYSAIAADYARGFDLLESLKCDVFLGAHGAYYGLPEKYEQLKRGDENPFVDPDGYKAYIAERRRTFETKRRDQQQDALHRPRNIGSRRELFLDSTLVEELTNAERRLHHPVAREIAIVHDAPWEGAGSGYHTVLRDGDLYRMYYRGSSLGVKDGRLQVGKQVYCYAESRDGVNFTKPNLGLVEYNGSKDNNIIWDGVGSHNFAPFIDHNPNCAPDAKFKALGGLASEGGLFAFKSADGIHWKLIQPEPVVTEGAFDSQNLAFWDYASQSYRAYFRTFTKGITTGKVWKPEGFRAIRGATSPDFLSWGNYADLTYADSPEEHLYTNQIGPYFRAPHILIGLPTRYVERGWSPSMKALPQLKERENRAAGHLRYGTSLTEALLMSSRNGVHFERWNEAFVRPGPERPDTWLYGHQFLAWHAVQTKSTLTGASDELSFYGSEGSWIGKSNAMRRYTLRLDGFVSVHAGWKGGTLETRPIIFDGNRLSLNFSTGAAGSIRVEIRDAAGEPITGFHMADCHEVFGDSTNRIVQWNSEEALQNLAGKTVRLRIKLKDADLYSLQFQK